MFEDLIKEIANGNKEITEEQQEKLNQFFDTMKNSREKLRTVIEDMDNIPSIKEYQDKIEELTTINRNLAQSNNELISTVEILNSKLNTYENSLTNIYDRVLELRKKEWYYRMSKRNYDEILDMIRIIHATWSDDL